MSKASELLEQVERLHAQYGVGAVTSALQLIELNRIEVPTPTPAAISGGSNGKAGKNPKLQAAARKRWAKRKAAAKAEAKASKG